MGNDRGEERAEGNEQGPIASEAMGGQAKHEAGGVVVVAGPEL
jgi:hypothetical protein